MATNIEMPKLSDTMTEGTLVSWKVQVGDEVEIGDVIAEIETDKATMEMEAFDEGVMTEILVQEGGKAPIGAVLAVLSEEGEAASSSSTASSAAPAVAAAPAPAASAETASADVINDALLGDNIAPGGRRRIDIIRDVPDGANQVLPLRPRPWV